MQADPVHIGSAFRVQSEGGTDLKLPPSYILSDAEWESLNFEVERLQAAETRLKAENESLKQSLADAPQGGWAVLATCAMALGAGIYLGSQL